MAMVDGKSAAACCPHLWSKRQVPVNRLTVWGYHQSDPCASSYWSYRYRGGNEPNGVPLIASGVCAPYNPGCPDPTKPWRAGTPPWRHLSAHGTGTPL